MLLLLLLLYEFPFLKYQDRGHFSSQREAGMPFIIDQYVAVLSN
jgi:hypothetical protein